MILKFIEYNDYYQSHFFISIKEEHSIKAPIPFFLLMIGL